MNYRHAFHAGNFADVFKHATLARILTYLARKAAPLRFIDTHAGLGRYDLMADEAKRTGEWSGGIGAPALREAAPAVAALFEPYWAAVGPLDAAGCPLSYPGSPAIAQHLLRPADRLTLCELHPDDCEQLRATMGRDPRVKTLLLDGYAGLKAGVPPKERRGLVLIDPPFETPGEFDRMGAALLMAYRKWPTGSYMLWYPLKDLRAADALGRAVVTAGVRDVLQLHLSVERRLLADGPLGGCGLLLVNPPYTLKQDADVMLPFLAQALGRGGPGGWSARQLAGD